MATRRRKTQKFADYSGLMLCLVRRHVSRCCQCWPAGECSLSTGRGYVGPGTDHHSHWSHWSPHSSHSLSFIRGPAWLPGLDSRTQDDATLTDLGDLSSRISRVLLCTVRGISPTNASSRAGSLNNRIRPILASLEE